MQAKNGGKSAIFGLVWDSNLTTTEPPEGKGHENNLSGKTLLLRRIPRRIYFSDIQTAAGTQPEKQADQRSAEEIKPAAQRRKTRQTAAREFYPG